MNADQAKFLAGYFASLMEQETVTTAKVLAAVPDDKRDYKPDAKSRTAWELTTHLATGDVWFLQSILDGKFEMDPAEAEKAEKQFSTVAEVVEFYKREVPPRIKALRELPAEKLTQVVDFFGVTKQPNAALLRHRHQPRRPSSRPAGGVPARDGFEGARASTAAAPTSRSAPRPRIEPAACPFRISARSWRSSNATARSSRSMLPSTRAWKPPRSTAA